jgi:hypothetical protein
MPVGCQARTAGLGSSGRPRRRSQSHGVWLPGRSAAVAVETGERCDGSMHPSSLAPGSLRASGGGDREYLAVKTGVDRARCIPACIQTSRALFDSIVPDSTVRLCQGVQRREERRPQTDPYVDNNRMRLVTAHS